MGAIRPSALLFHEKFLGDLVLPDRQNQFVRNISVFRTGFLGAVKVLGIAKMSLSEIGRFFGHTYKKRKSRLAKGDL
jgi:hypothetical protein